MADNNNKEITKKKKENKIITKIKYRYINMCMCQLEGIMISNQIYIVKNMKDYANDL